MSVKKDFPISALQRERSKMTSSFFATVLPAFVVMATIVEGDITGTNPSSGSCLCPSTGSLNIRDAPCGTVVGIAGYNQCFTYTGNKQTCTLDIEYEFFEVNFDGQPGWAAGNYLNLEQKTYCSQYPCGVQQSSGSERTDSKQSRLIGGSDAVRNAWPWQLAVETGNDGNWNLACGAVLIDSQWALTSADCLRTVEYPIRVLAGVYARSEPVLPEQIRLVEEEQVTVHPDFSSSTLENNIAIIRLTEPYDLSVSGIRNVCLPPDSTFQFYENPACYLTGWGTNQADGTSPVDILQRAGIDVIRPANCELLTETLPLAGEVCTYDQVSRSVSACTGDMGGPLSCLVNTRFQLAGIASYTAAQCNPRRPQVYTSIPIYIDWIKLVTGIE